MVPDGAGPSRTTGRREWDWITAGGQGAFREQPQRERPGIGSLGSAGVDIGADQGGLASRAQRRGWRRSCPTSASDVLLDLARKWHDPGSLHFVEEVFDHSDVLDRSGGRDDPQLAQMIDEAVKLGALTGNPVRSVKPLRVTDSEGTALEPDEVKALLATVVDHRLGAAVALLFLQGWRISEVLGLAWQDLDLDAGTARVRRASCTSTGEAGSSVRPRPTALAVSTG